MNDFGPQEQDDAKFLIALRNKELHSSERAYDSVSDSVWLPKFLRVVKKIAAHFNEEPGEYLDAQFLKHAENLVDAEDKKLKQDVATRINSCLKVFEGLTTDERTARAGNSILRITPSVTTNCPACKTRGRMYGEKVRTEREMLHEDDTITRRSFVVAQYFDCPICKLTLAGTAEIAASGMAQSWTTEEFEDLETRYLNTFDGEDYGND